MEELKEGTIIRDVMKIPKPGDAATEGQIITSFVGPEDKLFYRVRMGDGTMRDVPHDTIAPNTPEGATSPMPWVVLQEG